MRQGGQNSRGRLRTRLPPVLPGYVGDVATDSQLREPGRRTACRHRIPQNATTWPKPDRPPSDRPPDAAPITESFTALAATAPAAARRTTARPVAGVPPPAPWPTPARGEKPSPALPARAVSGRFLLSDGRRLANFTHILIYCKINGHHFGRQRIREWDVTVRGRTRRSGAPIGTVHGPGPSIPVPDRRPGSLTGARVPSHT